MTAPLYVVLPWSPSEWAIVREDQGQAVTIGLHCDYRDAVNNARELEAVEAFGDAVRRTAERHPQRLGV